MIPFGTKQEIKEATTAGAELNIYLQMEKMGLRKFT